VLEEQEKQKNTGKKDIQQDILYSTRKLKQIKK